MFNDHTQNLGQLENDARYGIGTVSLDKATGRFDATAPGDVIRIWPNIIFPDAVYRLTLDVLTGGGNVQVLMFGIDVGIAAPGSVFEVTMTSTFGLSNRDDFHLIELRPSSPSAIRDVVLELRSPLDRALAGRT